MLSVLRVGRSLLTRQTFHPVQISLKFYSNEITKEEITELKRTWKMAEKLSPKLAKQTFQNLFETNPEYAEFFTKWGKCPETLLGNEKFINDHLVGNVLVTLGKAVKKIDDPCDADKLAKKVGKKHIKYCVGREHFMNARVAFLKALKKILGDQVTCDGEKAWDKATTVIFKGLAKGAR